MRERRRMKKGITREKKTRVRMGNVVRIKERKLEAKRKKRKG